MDNPVLAQLRQHGITPAPVCFDAMFMRCLYLDVTGTLPTAAEAREFLANCAPDKRAVRDREPATIAQAVALTFMGARAERWPAERLTGMAAFFGT